MVFCAQYPAPRIPFNSRRAPKMNIAASHRLLLAQVAQNWHRQNGPRLCQSLFDFIKDSHGGTGGTGENQPIAHAHARACARVIIFFHYILIIIKSACSTCDSTDIIKVSPVPVACASLCHLCRAG